MSWTTIHGEQVETPRQEMRDEVIQSKARGLAMRGLRDQCWSLRQIAEFFSGQWHPQQVKRLIEQTKAGTKAQESLDRCGADGPETAWRHDH